MPDFKFAKGFFTGVLVTDVVVTTGLLCLTWYALKPRENYNRSLSRYDRYSKQHTSEQNKEFL